MSRCECPFNVHSNYFLPNHMRFARSSRPYYIHLGALPDFSDGLIEFCYSRQTLCDPEKIPMYFQCLREIASARQSDTLQLRATMLESRGVVSQNMINEAYQYFNIQLDHANVVTDNMIIDRYNARLPDVGPDERVRAKHMLKLLADARNSQAMRDASSDSKSLPPKAAMSRNLLYILSTLQQLKHMNKRWHILIRMHPSLTNLSQALSL